MFTIINKSNKIILMLLLVIYVYPAISGSSDSFITITTAPSGLTFSVDGISYNSQQVFNWTVGSSHLLSVESIIDGGSGIRYQFSSWSDDGTQNHTYIVTEYDQTITANYINEYYLTIDSFYGSPTGQGWYQAGTTANFGLTTPIPQGDGYQRVVFTKWLGVGAGSYSGENPQSSVVMNNPITETANWKQQVLLVVASVYGTTTGGGWYDVGSVATISISPSIIGVNSKERLTFYEWEHNNCRGRSWVNDTTWSFYIDCWNTFNAKWLPQYFLETAENPDAGGNITPPPPGEWYLSGAPLYLNSTVADGYEWSGWTGDISGMTKPYLIYMNTPKSVTANFQAHRSITITTNQTGIEFYVDGSLYSNSQVFNWDEGSVHALSLISPQSINSNMQYVFTSWSDGGAQTHSYTVPGSNTTVTANFNTQYYLNIISSHGNPKGSGWYDSGANANFSVSSPDVQGTTQYLLSNWSGDASGTSTSGSINMNSAKTVYANWNTQYYMNVNSIHGNPHGSGWYNAGVTANFSVTTPNVQGTTRYAFVNWKGDLSGTNPSGSTSMTIAKTVTANWGTQYYLSTSENPNAGGDMTPVPPGGWYDSGVNVPIDATVNSGYQWAGWSGDLSGFTKPSAISMDGPKNVTATFTSVGKIRVQTNPAGLAVIVDGVSYISPQDFTWANGSTHKLDVSSPQSGGSGIRYVFQDWSDGEAQTHSITLDGMTIYTANLTTQYYLTTAENPDVGGDITPAPPGEWYNSGDTVEVKASPNTVSGYVFSGWSGDKAGVVNYDQVIMTSPKKITGNFKIGDGQAPFIKYCYPCPLAISVPKNTEIQFKLMDQEGGWGIDSSTVDVWVNETTIVSGGIDRTDGQAIVTSLSYSYRIRYTPLSDFVESDTVTVHVSCHDLAHPANLMDSTYAFIVGGSRLTILKRDTVDRDGGVVSDGSTGIAITIPGEALNDTTEITIGVIQNTPPLPDTLHGLGLTYHFGPDGLHFADSVIVCMPYTQADLDSADVTDPMNLPIYYFSTMDGEWIKLNVFYSTTEYIYVKAKEFCYLAFGKVKKGPSAVEERTLGTALLTSFVLLQNYPNPFNPTTTIQYEIPKAGNVTILIYNKLGQKLRTLVDEFEKEGSYKAIWDGRKDNGEMVGSGLYLYSIRSGGYKKMMKAVLIE